MPYLSHQVVLSISQTSHYQVTKMTAEAQQLNQGFYYTFTIKLSALVSLAALAGMLMVQFNLIDLEGGTYNDIISGFKLTHDRLPVVMLLSGLCLLVVASVTAWLISRYASFKFAGPMYRFTKNIEGLIADRCSPVLPIRRNDCLQYESNILSKAVNTLRLHERAIEKTLLEMKRVIQSQESHPDKQEQLRPLVIRLKMLNGKVRL